LRRRLWLAAMLGGGAVITIALACYDVSIVPPEGRLGRLVLWPAEVFMWLAGSGPALPNGRHEWTPVQDLAMWIGVGASWAFWIGVVRILVALRQSLTRASDGSGLSVG
jgi:hypothetical protein